MKTYWKVFNGKIPVLLVSSHNYPHIIEGHVKIPDIHTDRVVKKLHDKTNSFAIISSGAQKDPNWHIDPPFRSKIKKLISEKGIEYVIDIHGRKINHPVLVEVFPNKSFKLKVDSIVYKHFKVKKFKKDKQTTLSKDLDKLSIACAQIEIRKDGRLEDNENFLLVINIISNLVDSLL